jgi:Uma2 family endonuclease
MAVTAQTFEELALANPDRLLEMHHGRVREKPPMTWTHTDLLSELGYRLRRQIDPRRFRVHVNGARLRRADGGYYMPDIAVIPAALGRPFLDRSDVLSVLDGPVPLVVEIWSPSTGDYDVDEKLPEYQARGDLKIWRLHPYDRTITAFRRTPEGAYERHEYRGGVVRCQSLPEIEIDFDDLFAWARDIEG